MTPKILVIGSEGQLGQCIKAKSNSLEACFTFTTLETLDVTHTEDLTKAIRADHYNYIINCTAYTAVDKAEEESSLAYKINSEALMTIGRAAHETGAKVVHVSTDYVFDGTNHRPYTEEDDTAPQSVYGRSKRDGEQYLFDHNQQSIVLRTSWLYSPHGNNFVKTMLRMGKERDELGVIYDQIGSPTYAGDLADVILHIIRHDMMGTIPFTPGIYHYSNEGVASWYDFTLAIHKLAGIQCEVRPIETKEYPTPAPRPHYSVLNKAKLKSTYQLEIPHWNDSLKHCISVLTNK